MEIPSYKTIIELIKKGATVEAQEKIMELREVALDLKEENLQLRERLRELEAQLQRETQLTFENGVYWLIDGDAKDGPFCQQCYDADQKLMRLQVVRNSDYRWRCLTCKHVYR